jgi:hypothetical protein
VSPRGAHSLPSGMSTGVSSSSSVAYSMMCNGFPHSYHLNFALPPTLRMAGLGTLPRLSERLALPIERPSDAAQAIAESS